MAEDIQLKAVVSNTSPLITLAAVGLLDILRQLYGAVVVPEAVRDEYEAGRKSAEPGLDDLQWIHVVASTPDPTLPDSLAPGEAAAIATAIALNARTVLLDERLGQRVANQMGLPVAGTLAILLRAKSAGLLPAVRPVLEAFVDQGMHLSESLYITIDELHDLRSATSRRMSDGAGRGTVRRRAPDTPLACWCQ